MEWVGKKSLVEVIKNDPRFETKKLSSDKSNELAVNIYFAWKPDSLQLADVAGDEEEEPRPIMTQNKRARKSGRGGKTVTTRASLESPQKRKQAVGVRTRRQARLKDEEAVVKQEDVDDIVKKEEEEEEENEEEDEDGNAEDPFLDLPSIDDIINGRS
jgi:hypothetical protein